MISPSTAFIGKVLLKGAVILIAAEAVAYELTPENMLGIATLVISALTALGILGTVILGFMNRNKLQELHISLDGMLGKLIETTKTSSKAEGVIAGREQRDTEIATEQAGVAVAKRDEKIVNEISDAVVVRIGEAADSAAKTMPGSTPTTKP